MKYLLRLDCEPLIEDVADKARYIRQGYLSFSKGMSLRIRETKQQSKTVHELTFKQKVQSRVIEVEKKLDSRDFNELWDTTANRLEKIRYDLINGDYKWEIDCFKDHNHETYIIVAECELPEGVEKPTKIPKIIEKNLLYAVPREDDRFASKKIADVKFAQNLYQEYSSVETI